ncbi:hypothetical protein GDO78_021079 [Eleutherodactylus coqui]|uniref:Solute carrier family 43 member 3 n=1 Tax=Eleutherodactylus coqui TaxID=57060 RepID=A0A8J6ENG3_ELECQ|nr:hypothetical protein GDO78_021079 [Eleutherodactylus coqui]
MGRLMRLWLLSSALVETLLFSGCLLGWNSLNPILLDMGVLSQDCHAEMERTEAASSNNSAAGAGHPPSVAVVSTLAEIIMASRTSEPQQSCTSQEQNLHLGFTVGTFFVWGAFLPLQLLLGYMNVRSLRQIGGALLSVSYLMLAYCLTNPHNLSLFLPFALIAQGLGGCCVLFSSLMLPQLLDNVGSLFSALVIASFSASATVFTIFKVIYFSWVPIVPVMLGYGAMSCLMFLNSTFCWSLNPSEKKEENIYSVNLRLNCYEALNKKKPLQEDKWCQKSLKLKFQRSLRDRERILSQRRTLSFKRPDVLAPSPLLESLISPTFILHLLSDSTLLTWIYFYVSSVNLHLQSQADLRHQADLYSSVFGGLQILGLFAAPLISILLHYQILEKPIKSGQTKARTSHRSACSIKRLSAIYTLRSLVAICFGICCLIPSLHIQVVSFVLHVVMRTSMFLVTSTLYRCMFPRNHFGALLGINTFISSILSLVQHPIFLLLTGSLQRDLFWIYITFLALSPAALLLPIHLVIKNNRRHSRPLSHPIHLCKMTPITETNA